jgi:hypothetical protein
MFLFLFGVKNGWPRENTDPMSLHFRAKKLPMSIESGVWKGLIPVTDG